MITYDDLVSIPPPIEPLRGPNTPEELASMLRDKEGVADGFHNRLEDYWRNEGVDPEGLHQFCLDHAESDFDTLMVALMATRSVEASVGAVIATAYHVGFSTGWNARKTKR